jgi:sirohydrochlorin ferrochelatase
MPSYLLELYVPRAGSVPQASEVASRIADAATSNAGEIRYVRTLFLAEDETCLHVFEAPSREALVEAARCAGIPDARVTEAVESTDDRSRP